MTKKNQFVKNLSPMRSTISKLVNQREMTCTEISKNLPKHTTERTRNILEKMIEDDLISKYINDKGRAMYTKFVPRPKVVAKAHPVCGGTVRGPLDTSFMRINMRAGAQDAMRIQSRGV